MNNKTRAERSIKTTLQRWFILYAAVPMFILMGLFFLFVFLTSGINNRERTEAASEKIAAELEQNFASDWTFLEAFSTSSLVKQLLRGEEVEKPALYETFYRFNSQQKISTVLHIMNTDGDLLFATDSMQSEDQAYFSRFIFPRLNRSQNPLSERCNFIFRGQRSSAYFLAVPIMEESIHKGWAVLFLTREDFLKVLTVAGNDIAMAVDDFDRVILSTNSQMVNAYGKSSFEEDWKNTAFFSEKVYDMASISLSNVDMTVFTYNPKETGRMLYFYLLVFSLLIGLFFFFSIRFLSRRLSVRLTGSIDQLIEGVRHTQSGDLSYYVHIESGDEFQFLAEQYNQMVDMIAQLLKDKEKLTQLKQQAEFKNLESQFHPHFLFNTLETLKYAILMGSDTAPKMLTSLTRFLKYQAYGTEQEVSLEEELNLAQEYMALHAYRFGDHFNFSVEADESLLEEKIPKWTLQPILENAIKYGYQNQTDLQIIIQVEEVDGQLSISVKDNGKIMTQETLILVRELLLQEQMPKNHTGLYNIQRRLKILYGEEALC